ncbi:MAG: hypothetical protein RMI90_02255, partial [Thermoguttaceae bacterium]|nr:hypothetical protein [Thermoguttaceae bacterium]
MAARFLFLSPVLSPRPPIIHSIVPTSPLLTSQWHWYLQLFLEPQYVGVNWSARPQHLVGESRHGDANTSAEELTNPQKFTFRWLGVP